MKKDKIGKLEVAKWFHPFETCHYDLDLAIALKPKNKNNRGASPKGKGYKHKTIKNSHYGEELC